MLRIKREELIEKLCTEFYRANVKASLALKAGDQVEHAMYRGQMKLCTLLLNWLCDEI